jgi:hypothetical protein
MNLAHAEAAKNIKTVTAIWDDFLGKEVRLIFVASFLVV